MKHSTHPEIVTRLKRSTCIDEMEPKAAVREFRALSKCL